MPAGLYPKNKKLQVATRREAKLDPAQVVDRLLCGECEQRFNRNGEDEVLRWLAQKAKKGKSPLWEALQTATPVFRDSDLDATTALGRTARPHRRASVRRALSCLVWPGDSKAD
jgi:hypothetical protein